MANAEVTNIQTTIAEDIAYFTWAKHRFRMKMPEEDLILRFYAYQYNENVQPLHIDINGNVISYDSDEGYGRFMVHECRIPRGFLINGINEIIFKSDSRSANTWAIAIEHVDNPLGSAKSTDRGKTWYSRALGYNFSVVGQYAIRLLDSRGNAVTMETVEPQEEAPPRVVKTSKVENLTTLGGSDLVKSITLTIFNKAEGDILQVRSGATPEPDILSWTPWRTVKMESYQSIINPVRLQYLQWRILNSGERRGSDPAVEVSVKSEREITAAGEFESFSFEKVMKDEDIFNCPRDVHIEMDPKAGGARLRRGELIKDDDANAQLNIDRTAFEASDSLLPQLPRIYRAGGDHDWLDVKGYQAVVAHPLWIIVNEPGGVVDRIAVLLE